ncbi:MAG TPA: chemotaxis protein CheD [Tepidisphaeraceae bacterium]
MQLTVNISDAKVSSDPSVVLATYSLGSCIGVTLWDSKIKVGGMLHFQLPTSTIDAQRAQQNPLMFADTGFAALLEEMIRKGADKKRMKVRMAGAAQMLNDSKIFDIGRRNHAAMRKILWQHGMFIDAEHVGGSAPRTMYLNVADGSVTLKMGSETIAI